jgi:predicted nucleic acid-binding protein
MPVFYLDTSAVLKRYRTEAGTDVVDAIYDERHSPKTIKSIFSGIRSDVLVTSYFTCLEVESVASRMFRGKLLDEKSYKALLNSFARDIDNHMTVLPVNSGLIRSAIDAAREYALRPGDSLHVATAQMALDSQDDTVFVCSDRRLLEVVGDDALMRVLDPESPNAMEQLSVIRGRRPIDLP